MPSILLLVFAAIMVVYGAMCALLHSTQNKKEPRLLPTIVPFLDPAIGIAKDKVNYLVNLRHDLPSLHSPAPRALTMFRTKYRLPIFTMRMPFQRMYIVNAAELIRIIQTKANLTTFIPNLLDFGLLFSGVNKESRKLICERFAVQGNGFTMSVHKFLTRGSTLQDACQTAVNKLAASVPNSFSPSGTNEISLLETIKHDLMLALTGLYTGPRIRTTTSA
jgi:hypothetical protein